MRTRRNSASCGKSYLLKDGQDLAPATGTCPRSNLSFVPFECVVHTFRLCIRYSTASLS